MDRPLLPEDPTRSAAISGRRLVAGLGLWLCGLTTLPAQPVVETVFFDVPAHLVTNAIPEPTAQLRSVPGYPDDPSRLTLIGRLYRPDPNVHGPPPHPAVVFLHGAGGLWSSNTIPAVITTNNAPASQFRDWGNLLANRGYAALMVDSFNPRGIPGDFDGRRPHHDPAIDDALCSPNYERPKDVVAALEYLASRGDMDLQRTALIGFSHGAQTGMNAVVDSSVDLGLYQVDYVDLVGTNEVTVKKSVPSPVRIPSHLPFPKFCAFYYGGGSHYGYHGPASSTAPGRYMVDRRTSAILFHGTGDALMAISNLDAVPITGNLWPVRQVLASAAQAASLGLPNPIVHHRIFDRTAVHPANQRVGHSFDLGTVAMAAPADWDTANESPNQKARRLARDEVLRWLDFKLKPAPVLQLTLSNHPPGAHHVAWSVSPGFWRSLQASGLAGSWTNVVEAGPGLGSIEEFAAAPPVGGKIFYRLHYQPAPAPTNAAEHAGFFRRYGDFSLP